MTDPRFTPAAPRYWLLDLVHPRTPERRVQRFLVSADHRVGTAAQASTARTRTISRHPVTLVWRPCRDAVIPILGTDGVVRLTNGTNFAGEAEWLAHAADQARARAER